MYERLSEEVKEVLVYKDPADSFLNTYITLYKDIDTRMRVPAEEKQFHFSPATGALVATASTLPTQAPPSWSTRPSLDRDFQEPHI